MILWHIQIALLLKFKCVLVLCLSSKGGLDPPVGYWSEKSPLYCNIIPSTRTRISICSSDLNLGGCLCCSALTWKDVTNCWQNKISGVMERSRQAGRSLDAFVWREIHCIFSKKKNGFVHVHTPAVFNFLSSLVSCTDYLRFKCISHLIYFNFLFHHAVHLNFTRTVWTSVLPPCLPVINFLLQSAPWLYVFAYNDRLRF